MKNQADYPEYLRALESLQQHIRGHLEGLTTTDKGILFANFVRRLVPQTAAGAAFKTPTLSPKISDDGGVDLSASGRSSELTLRIQSKLFIDRADAIDSIISKFQAYTAEGSDQQLRLFSSGDPPTHFMVVTLSRLERIRKAYERAAYASKPFYQQCVAEERFHFVDGEQILRVLRTAYGKLARLPHDIPLTFETPYITLGNVFIGVLSSTEIKALYETFGDALFFENVRDFLGTQRQPEIAGRTSTNVEIAKTVATCPEKMLSRNNGIVFGAQKVERDSGSTHLLLKSGSVVNGCQTTMCIVEYAERPSSVLVKVVETDDAWDITKSANTQNSVADIDLELARYLRPQLVKRAATDLGVRVTDFGESAFQIVDAIHNRKVAYDETRLLYIGLFSRTPNNVFAGNYTELMQDLIGRLYKESSYETEVFKTLFLLQHASQKSLEDAQAIFSNESYAPLFERLYNPDSPSYRCFISILALSGSIGVNIAQHNPDPVEEVKRVREFLDNAQALLEGQEEKFAKFHKLAVKMWMQDVLTEDDDAKVRRDMSLESKRANFNVMFRKLCMEADLEASHGRLS